MLKALSGTLDLGVRSGHVELAPAPPSFSAALSTLTTPNLPLPHSRLSFLSSSLAMPDTHPLNLKVLQRHDPSIVSIIDSATYVVLYHYEPDGWKKEGVEGSMFIFRR